MNRDFSTLVASTNLLAQASDALERRLTLNPNDSDALINLGNLYRKQGKLAKAAESYERANQLIPGDARAQYLQSLMSGESLMPWPGPSNFQPAPFVLLKDYLATDLQERLLGFAIANRTSFLASKVGPERYRPDVNQSLTLYDVDEIRDEISAAVTETLKEIVGRLLLQPFALADVMLQIKAYNNGDFFKVHHDSSPFSVEDDTPPERKYYVSFAYFFHRQPRRFTGGDLLLFDTDFGESKYVPTGFTRVTPDNNSIIFYPSACFHEATPVSCESGDFADSRFAILGAFSVNL